MIAESTLRELRCEHRTFKTVAGALLWYAGERLKRQGGAVPLEIGTIPRSRESIDRAQATYAKIVGCLTPRAPEDWDSRAWLDEQAVEDLIGWYESEEPQQDLASARSMNWEAFCSYCRRTRNLVRRRMKARGLLADDGE